MFDFKFNKHGTHPISHKKKSIHTPISPFKQVDEYVYPMSMHLGAPATPTVAVGDAVLKGQCIAQASGFISANVHSSISGTVIAIEKRPTLNGLADCVVIKNDFQDTWAECITHTLDQLNKEQIVQLAKNAGITGMGGAGFPSNVKLSPAPEDRIDTVIINAAECEPYINADARLIIERAEILKSYISIFKKVFPSLKKLVFAIEAHNKEAIAALKKVQLPVQVLATLYPQGAEKTLIKSITSREVPSGGLPAHVGCFVTNVATLNALGEAIFLGKPLISRIVTVSGTSVKNPQNYEVLLGTPVEHLLDSVSFNHETTVKVLSGGPMMGRTLSNLLTPVIKATNGITVLDKNDCEESVATDCIRCSSCLYGCPMHLQPILISRSSVNGDFDKAFKLGAMDCIECGNCSFGCPAKIDLLEDIRNAKNHIRAASQKAKVNA